MASAAWMVTRYSGDWVMLVASNEGIWQVRFLHSAMGQPGQNRPDASEMALDDVLAARNEDHRSCRCLVAGA